MYLLNSFDNEIYIIDVKVNGLKINLKNGVLIQCFRRRPQQVRLCVLHCDVECFKTTTMYISNLANVPRFKYEIPDIDNKEYNFFFKT